MNLLICVFIVKLILLIFKIAFLMLLNLAPHGQMHIETGLQTFFEDTYDIVQRIGPMDKTVSGLTRLCSMKNVEVHADLIGGLPGCTVDSHYEDLMTLFKMEPHEIQLENLKNSSWDSASKT